MYKIFIYTFIIQYPYLIFTGKIHKSRRKAIELLFNTKFLSNYMIHFDNYSNRYVDCLEKEISNAYVDVKHHLRRYMLDVFLGNNRSI
jgi:hypothetical protein